MVARRRAVANQKPQVGFFLTLPVGAGVTFVEVVFAVAVAVFAAALADVAGNAAAALGAAAALAAGALDAATASLEGGGATLAEGAGSLAPSIAVGLAPAAGDDAPRAMNAMPEPTSSTATAPTPSHVAPDRAGRSGGGMAD